MDISILLKVTQRKAHICWKSLVDVNDSMLMKPSEFLTW